MAESSATWFKGTGCRERKKVALRLAAAMQHNGGCNMSKYFLMALVAAVFTGNVFADEAKKEEPKKEEKKEEPKKEEVKK